MSYSNWISTHQHVLRMDLISPTLALFGKISSENAGSISSWVSYIESKQKELIEHEIDEGQRGFRRKVLEQTPDKAVRSIAKSIFRAVLLDTLTSFCINYFSEMVNSKDDIETVKSLAGLEVLEADFEPWLEELDSIDQGLMGLIRAFTPLQLEKLRKQSYQETFDELVRYDTRYHVEIREKDAVFQIESELANSGLRKWVKEGCDIVAQALRRFKGTIGRIQIETEESTLVR